MSLQNKLDNAKSTTWLSDGIPKWQVWWIVHWSKFKARIRKMKND